MSNIFNNPIKIYALGGLGEVGKNTYCIESVNDLIILDAGVKFPEDDLVGVDYVIPNYQHLKDNQSKIRALFITHGHEDHIGAIPFLVKSVKIPVIYAPKLACALIKQKLDDQKIKEKVKLVEYDQDSVITAGCFKVSFIRVTHSIPDSFGICVDTPEGRIVDTGDFKLDLTPVGPDFELHKMSKLGEEGVDLLLADSTNAEKEGWTPSEKNVLDSINEIFDKAPSRLIISTFSSNISRIQQIVDCTIKHNRKIVIVGRSMINTMELAMEIGEIRFDHKLIVDIEKVDKYADNEILILATGSQGQEHTALDRMVKGEMANIKIGANDVVVFSSSPVPGNEKSVTNIINQLITLGARVIYDDLSDVHASGHACQTEFMIIHKLVRPKFFMPMHGEVKHLKYHEQFAIKMGVKPQNIVVPHVGSVVEVTPNTIKQLRDFVPAGEKIVDGKTICDIDNSVLRDRLQLAEDGICVVVFGINSNTGKLVNGPELIPRGFIYPNEINDIVREAKQVVIDAMAQNEPKPDWNEIKATVRKVLTNLFFKRTKRKPLIIPIILEV